MVPVTCAATLARDQLAASVPRRWRHVQAVAARAEAIGHVIGRDAKLLVAAAWLHDVGYSPDLAETGFHPLDGARWLRRIGFDAQVTALVAHHSCAWIEAGHRGLADELAAEFPPEESALADALTYCDMVTGPTGERMTVEERLAEIEARYASDDVVADFVRHARPELIAAVRRTEDRLKAADVHPM